MSTRVVIPKQRRKGGSRLLSQRLKAHMWGQRHLCKDKVVRQSNDDPQVGSLDVAACWGVKETFRDLWWTGVQIFAGVQRSLEAGAGIWRSFSDIGGSPKFPKERLAFLEVPHGELCPNFRYWKVEWKAPKIWNLVGLQMCSDRA